jgi:hypothetical protein
MDGKPYKAGMFALTLRQRLFSEHLGLTTQDARQDPLTDKFWEVRIHMPRY